jgi:FixJ family two-component response regulator
LQKVPVISIIDDDESVRRATKNLVRSLGFEAHTFASAEDFLGSPRAAETACVISDIQMPAMSGVELQEQLAARGRRTPIIFITAFPNERTEARVMNAGAVCYLAKPFEGRSLVRCIDAALALGREAAGA